MKLKYFSLIAYSIVLFSCKKDADPVIVPSGGTIKLDGIVANEAGSVAGNSVYIDLSTNKTTTSLRSGWDIGLYAGNLDRAILNFSTCAGAKVLSKNNLNNVTAADTIGLILATSSQSPMPSDFAFFDNLSGNIMQTVIPAVSTDNDDNKVIIVNRGTGGSIAPRPWVKMRILKITNGYTVQYANILDTSFKTITILKNNLYNFQFLSFDKGLVNAEPEKLKWDFVWGYSLYQTYFGAYVPYNFSDIISLNTLAGVLAKERVYADASTATASFAAFNTDSLANYMLSDNRWTIANNWRITQPGPTGGAKFDRFYIIKDANSNFYKLKCLAMGAGNDGGTRGKPEFKYELIK